MANWTGRNNSHEAIEKGMLIAPHGDLAEFGVNEGSTTRKLAEYGRHVWAFDTFEGIPQEEFLLGEQNEPGKFKPGFDVIARLATECPNVTCIKGRFINTLPYWTPDKPIALAYIDCDAYISHIQVMSVLKRFLVPGSVLVFDDVYNLPEAARAIEHSIEGREVVDQTVIW